MKTIMTYETDDGQVFKTQDEAVKHEAELKQKKEIEQKAGYAKTLITMPLQTFNSFVRGVDTLVDEAIIVVSKTGMQVMQMDPSGISMVLATVQQSSSANFVVEGSTLDLAFNFDKLDRNLRELSGKVRISVRQDKNGNPIGVFTVDDGTNDSKVFETPVIDMRAKADKEPKVDFTGSFTMQAEALQLACARCRRVGSYLTVAINNDSVVLEALSDRDVYRERYTTGKKLLAHKGGAKAVFNLEFFENMIKPASPENHITVELKDSQPVRLHYSEGSAQLAYYLAPYTEE